jgi:hypothetical protein
MLPLRNIADSRGNQSSARPSDCRWNKRGTLIEVNEKTPAETDKENGDAKKK